MRNKILLRWLTSIPILLIFLYFIPFLGICLILLRHFIYNSKKRVSTPIILISVGILILVPMGFNLIFDIIKFDKNVIPYFNEILNSQIYNVHFIKYSKFLITVGVVFFIIFFFIESIFQKLGSSLKTYIVCQEKRNSEILKKNDLIMKEKREKAKNTKVVICPYCGADNMLTEAIGTCKYCRRQIQSKN